MARAHVPERSRAVPVRAVALSLATFAVPVIGNLFVPETLGAYGALLWLTALLPAFLLAYYRGWRGAATALALGMATLSVTNVAALWQGRDLPDTLLGVVIVYIVASLGIGWLAERLLREKDEIEDLAFSDLLTGLPNRRHAKVFLENEFAAAERGRPLTAVLFDIDNFKAYNDRHGHTAGDAALKTFARILSTLTRKMNLSARFGGEEFISVLAGSEPEGATIFAERVITALGNASLEGGGRLAASAGVASHHPSMQSSEELIAAADHALHRAKSAGGGCVRVFGEALLDRDGAETGPESLPISLRRLERRIRGEDEEEFPPDAPVSQRVTRFGLDRRLLLVEDPSSLGDRVVEYLRDEGFEVTEVRRTDEVTAELGTEFDLVMLDLGTPGAAGTGVVTTIKSRWPSTQVIVTSQERSAEVAAEALNAGADRYVFKPYELEDLQGHLLDALRRRDRLLAAQAERRILSAEARSRAAQARDAVLRGAKALVQAVEVRDPYTRGHSQRVAAYALTLAEAVDPDGSLVDRETLQLACEVHDVGKIGISDEILNKTGRLTEDEMSEVQRHPRIGRSILEPLLEDDMVLSVVTWHHERWDGSGYPDGLAGDAIPLGARIVAVADALDAMTSDRALRDALDWSEAVEWIEEHAGSHFDPDVVEKFSANIERMRAICEEWRAAEEPAGS